MISYYSIIDLSLQVIFLTTGLICLKVLYTGEGKILFAAWVYDLTFVTSEGAGTDLQRSDLPSYGALAGTVQKANTL